MEADIPELWLHYSQKFLDKFGERPTIHISDRDTLILAILDLEHIDVDNDDDGDTSFD